MSKNKEEFEYESADDLPAAKSSDKSKTKALRANVGIMMQNELLSDMLYTLQEIKDSRNVSKGLLQSYRSAAEVDLENSNRYNKNILGSTRLTDEEIEEYTLRTLTVELLLKLLSVRVETMNIKMLPVLLKHVKILTTFAYLLSIFQPFRVNMMNGYHLTICLPQVFITEPT